MLEAKARSLIAGKAAELRQTLAPAPLTVGLSGGADSTLALIIACEMQFQDPRFVVRAVHCIHGLDEDDPIWLAHCQRLCQRLGVELITPKLHIVYGGGVSPEDASRQERYQALLKHMQKPGFLVLGHQKDDVIEGFILALKRGAGPLGLANMQSITQDARGTIVRPLLDLRKAEIEEILEALGFDFVFDISNTYLKFERNFVRLKVLPLLRERFAGVDEAIYRSSRLCAYEHELAQRYIDVKLGSCLDPSYDCLDFSCFDPQDEALCIGLIRAFIAKRTGMLPELSIVLEARRLMAGSPDQEGCIKVGDYNLGRFRERLFAYKRFAPPEREHFFLPCPRENEEIGPKLKLGDFSYQVRRLAEGETHPAAFGLKEGQKGLMLDFTYKSSERFKPWDRLHSREIKKLMAEYEVPRWWRQCMPRIFDEKGELIALGALRAVKKPPVKKPAYTLDIMDERNDFALYFVSFEEQGLQP